MTKDEGRGTRDMDFMPPERTPFQDFWMVFKGNGMAMAGLIILLIFFALAIMGIITTSGEKPLLDPHAVRLPDKLKPPLSKPTIDSVPKENFPYLGIYLLGTDELGRDTFARMLQGAIVSLSVGFVAVGISIILGVLIGGIAGFYGENMIKIDIFVLIGILIGGIYGGIISYLIKEIFVITGIPLLIIISILVGGILGGILVYFIKRGIAVIIGILVGSTVGEKITRFGRYNIMTVDTLIVALIDIQLSFPTFFLILTVVSLLPPSIWNIMAIIGITGWVGPARFVRADILSLREQEFILAAKSIGAPDLRIILLHLLPNSIAPVLVSATIGIATAILTESALSFLGFGVPPPNATWGNILSDGKKYIFDAPWLTYIPGITILFTVLAFNLFGEGLRDTLNPKLRT